MGEKYKECRKYLLQLEGMADGCQEFMESTTLPLKCDICGCHRNFHRKVEALPRYKNEVVYTKCHRIVDFNNPNLMDGCQEFFPSGGNLESLTCEACGCHKGFHRNEKTVEVTSTH